MAGGAAPVLEGAGRRWFLRHVGISLAVSVALAEVYWRLYALPRRNRRDEYYRRQGVEWTKIVE